MEKPSVKKTESSQQEPRWRLIFKNLANHILRRKIFSLPNSIPSNEKIVIENEEMQIVADRIQKFLPTDLIRQLFTSIPRATGDVALFPYCRVDSLLNNINDNLYLVRQYPRESKYFTEACNNAFRVIVWIEIGFEGISNLANSRASENWTSGIGHLVSTEERARKINTTEKEFYLEKLRGIREYRNTHKEIAKNDLFSYYPRIEEILNRI